MVVHLGDARLDWDLAGQSLQGWGKGSVRGLPGLAWRLEIRAWSPVA